MTVTEIRNILENPYQREVWKKFIQTQFTNNKLTATEHEVKLSDKAITKQCISLGNYEVDQNTKIGIFEVELNEKVNITRNRVGLRNLIKDITRQVSGAMVVFVQGDKWRFSYISKRKVKNKETHEIQDKETAPKRYTYLFGKSEKALTAAIRFDKLIQKQKENFFDFLTLDDFEDAFSVEKLSKEFFKIYKDTYEDFVQFITGKRYKKKGNKYAEEIIHEPHWQLISLFNKDEKQARDFCKRMMGRIVFLYFIQKKGWLAVAQGKKWGEGNPDYLFDLFKDSKHKDDFYFHELVPLFFKTLNNPDSENETNTFRFPYLNGGLFDDSHDRKYNKLYLPEEIFKTLFETFNNYNFTIYEDAPDEHTVAVDPEMLGHIFENLLEDNKEKGAFYTPKEIVHYMCSESLKDYLYAHEELYLVNNSIGKNAIIKIIQQQELSNDEKLFAEKNAYKIIDALDHVKICDPAIGSGAFPMGLLQEIFNTQIYLQELKGFKKGKSDADIKKHIIEESIYGVDIDAGAVDIARLRFWLSLVVDEPVPQPLPNLDFKILCANTLIPLGNIADLDFNEKAGQAVKELESLRHDFFNVSSENKLHLERQFKKIQTDLLNLRELASKTNYEIYTKLYEFNPFDDHSNSWFDAWWMFGIKDGFDIVIGNPPYKEVSDKSEKKFFQKEYAEYLSGHYDLFIFFFKKGIDLLNKKGILAFITPHTFLHYSQFENLRKKLLEQRILKLTEKIEAVFENAVVDTAITILQKEKLESYNIAIQSVTYSNGKMDFNDLVDIPVSELSFETFDLKAISKKKELIKYIENTKPLGEITESTQGITVYAKVQGEKINYFRNINSGEVNCKPFLKGRDFNKYFFKKLEQYIIYGSLLWCPRDPKYFESPKLFLRQTSDRLIATFIKEPYYAIDSVHSIIQKDKSFDLKYLLAIINSKFGNYLYQLLINEDGKVFAQVKLTFLRKLPMKILSEKNQIPFITLVDYLLFAYSEMSNNILPHTENSRLASHIEEILNMMVYELYFEEHMKENGIDVLQFINPKPIADIKTNEAKTEVIKDFYLWFQRPENAIRQRILLVETRSKDKIALINKAIQ